MHSSSISAPRSLKRWSTPNSREAMLASWLSIVSTIVPRYASTSRPRASISPTSRFSSFWKVSRGTVLSLAEAPGDVVLRLLAFGVGEHLVRLVKLPQPPRVAHALDVEKARVVRDARRLLHIV